MPGHLDVVEGLKPIRACSLLRACAGGDQEPGDDSALRAEYQPAQGVHAPPQLFRLLRVLWGLTTAALQKFLIAEDVSLKSNIIVHVSASMMP